MKTIKDLISRYSEDNILLIAEAGTAHMGNSRKAHELVDEAKAAGASCVKFQYVIADEIVHPRTGSIELPGGKTDLYEAFSRLEKPLSFYQDIQAYCREKDIMFLCTPFGPGSARALIEMKVEALKVASPELNYQLLLDTCADAGRPLILSTGVSYMADIKASISYIGDRIASDSLCLLQCVTSYPAPEEDYNLLTLVKLRQEYGILTGVSDHSEDPVLVPMISAALCGLMGEPLVLEKHFTLDRSGDGLDDRIALDTRGFGELRKSVIEIIPQAAAKSGPLPEAPELSDVISGFLPDIPSDIISSILGDGIKQPAPSEVVNYPTTRRSLRAVRDIKTGDQLNNNNTAWLRSEKNLKPGLDYKHFADIARLTAAADIPDGEAISAENSRRS